MTSSSDPNAAVVVPPLRAAAGRRLKQALELIARGEVTEAEQRLVVAMAECPGHPELLYGLGALQLRRGYIDESIKSLGAASAAMPSHFPVRVLLATALAAADRHGESRIALEAALPHATSAAEWLAIGIEADRLGYNGIAGRAASRVLATDPRHAQALLLRGRGAQVDGRIDAAVRDYREATRIPESAARAWFVLADLKTVKFEPGELKTLTRLASRTDLSIEDRTLLAFALGKAFEDAGEYPKAFDTYQQANRLARMHQFWNLGALSAQVDAIAEAFSRPLPCVPGDAGAEVIFLVGLPRSGSTLIEQVLAAHPRVEGASELPYLDTVIATESRRLRKPFPQWVASATADDWQRLGKEYLRLSARWRAERPIATDKLPENWLLAGAALSMLPAARVVDCRRDALETCWSCYKQLFASGRVGFAYDFETLAAYWHDYVRLSAVWSERFPARYRLQSYEQFVADPENQTRELLDFCGLEFESTCLRFHEAQRGIRTASASQVRQPLRRDTARGPVYGELLDKLRSLLQSEAAND